jgi:hypothetical protein
MEKLGIVMIALLVQSAPGMTAELYDFACCPNDDCHSAQSDTVALTPNGYHVESLNIIVPPDDSRIRVSKDGQFHICTRSTATPDMSQTIVERNVKRRILKCLYVPATS